MRSRDGDIDMSEGLKVYWWTFFFYSYSALIHRGEAAHQMYTRVGRRWVLIFHPDISATILIFTGVGGQKSAIWPQFSTSLDFEPPRFKMHHLEQTPWMANMAICPPWQRARTALACIPLSYRLMHDILMRLSFMMLVLFLTRRMVRQRLSRATPSAWQGKRTYSHERSHNTSSQRSMEALYCVVSARSIVSYTDGPMLIFVSHYDRVGTIATHRQTILKDMLGFP